jgi:hypothetical protein
VNRRAALLAPLLAAVTLLTFSGAAAPPAAAHAAQSTEPRARLPLVWQCFHATFKELDALSLWCFGPADHATVTSWPTWNQRRAVARATVIDSSTGAEGTVSVVFDQPRTVGGRRLYSRVTYRNPRGPISDFYDGTRMWLSYRRDEANWPGECRLVWVQDGYPSTDANPVCRKL